MTKPPKSRVRCAIYTRKSSDEGLEQDFNSLDAQREACEAFILSHKGEGWRALSNRYDDGGISGGTMQRPALKRLLADVEAGEVQLVVVYKIDRLTRSLSDFAKIVEVFDAKAISFVSVTQQFNTATSMGRLTLNMLLSFAQFEREVTGERIRDKIAASKRKGMWMGGLPPLGYDVADRRLVVNEDEAETVRHIFRRYTELGSVRLLGLELLRGGIVSKHRIDRHGRPFGGKPLARGALYRMLQNPIYRGEIVHKDRTYPGHHSAIVSKDLWDRVKCKLTGNRSERRNGSSAREPSLLAGLIVDDAGDRMIPTHANKRGRRYRYYVSQTLIKGSAPDGAGRRVPAAELERLVDTRLRDFLMDPSAVHTITSRQGTCAQVIEAMLHHAEHLAAQWTKMPPSEKRRRYLWLISRIEVRLDSIEIRLVANRLASFIDATTAWDEIPASGSDDGEIIELSVDATLKRTGIEKSFVIAGRHHMEGKVDPRLARLVARADSLRRIFVKGEASITELAKETGLSPSYFTRLLRIGFLGPDLTEAILDGRQPIGFHAKTLLADPRLPIDWELQRRQFGFR